MPSKSQFLADIVMFKALQRIPDDVNLNWDHTGINIIPGSAWTMDQKGLLHVELLTLDDKWQITAVVCGSLSATFPVDISGENQPVCLVTLLKDWHVTCIDNHWFNEQKTHEYIELVLLLYVKSIRRQLGMPDNFPPWFFLIH